MTCPFDIDFVCEPEMGDDVAANQFVGDDAVIDAFDLDVVEVEFAAAPFKIAHVGDFQTQHILRDEKVGKGLLLLRIDFEEDNLPRVVAVEDHSLEQALVAQFIEATDIGSQIGLERSETISAVVFTSERSLKCVDGREALNFDELRFERTLGVADQSEVCLQKQRLTIFVRNIEPGRDAESGGFQVFGIAGELFIEFLAIANHLVYQRSRKKDWCFTQAKGDVSARAFVNTPQKFGIELGTPSPVEFATQLRYHAG